MTSHRDDVKYYVILCHYDATSLAVSIIFLTFIIIFIKPDGYSAVLQLSLSMGKIWGSIPRPVKSDTV